MMNSDNKNANTDDMSAEPGYHTPGRDTTLQSSSAAVPVPRETSEQRLTEPQPSVAGETPGDANPALAETIGEEEGRVSTADLLAARETAEERPVQARGLPSYQDQSTASQPDEFQNADSGRPNWPDDLQVEPTEYTESPRADMPLLAGAPDVYDLNFKGRVDAEVDRSATQAAGSESRSGLSPVGHGSDEDNYERRDFERPESPSELETFAPGMVNLPPEEDNG